MKVDVQLGMAAIVALAFAGAIGGSAVDAANTRDARARETSAVSRPATRLFLADSGIKRLLQRGSGGERSCEREPRGASAGVIAGS